MNYNEQNCELVHLDTTTSPLIHLIKRSNIQGTLALVNSQCIDWNTGCQIKQLFTQGTQF